MNLEKFQEYLDDILFENWRENSIFILFSLSIIMFTASMLFVYYIYTIIAALVYIYCSLSCTVLVYMHLQLTYTKTYTHTVYSHAWGVSWVLERDRGTLSQEV